MNDKSEEKDKSNQKSKNSKNVNYILIVIIFLVVIFGANRFLVSKNSSLSASLFRSAIANNGGAADVTKKGFDYYMENYGQDVDPGTVEARRVNLGCHYEIHIYEEGILVMRLGYAGRIYEL